MMRTLREAVSRLIAVFRRRTLDRDFDDEFAAHIDLLTARNEGRGLPRDEARRQAILQIGGLTTTRDFHRQARGLPRVDRFLEALGGFARDLTHAARLLAKAQGFTLVCVTSLSVGMAAVIAIPYYARLLFMPPPGVNADGFVELLMTPRGPLRVEVGEWAREGWSYADYADLRDADTRMAITGWTVGESLVTLQGPDRARRVAVTTMFVSANYFRTVGVNLAQGPGFDAAMTASAADPVVILGYAFWQNRLGSDPDILGKTVTLNGTPHLVVGIAPDKYCWHMSECPGTQLFVPLERHPRLLAEDRLRLDRDITLVRIHGRLLPGVSRAQANAAVSAAMSALAEQYPATNEFKAASVEPYFALGALERSEITIIQALFLSVTGMVLLVVCLNISGMLQVRCAMRERELSVRQAIGATRGRLVWYLLSEAILLATVGGGLATFLLYTAPQALFWLMLRPLLPYVQEALRPTLPMIAFAVGLCVTTSLVLGLLPAIRFSRPALISALKDDAGGGGRRVGRMHRFAAALQVGIAMPFLVISGTMVDWVRTTAATELGFTPEGLAAVELTVDRDGEANQADFLLRRVRESLEGTHGIQRVTVADGLPLDFRARGTRVSRPGRSDGATARTTRVSDGYLETLNIQLLRGRGIAADVGAGDQAVAVVSKPLADRLFGDEDPIGERLTLDIENGPRVVTIVGVTADFVGRSLDGSREQLLLPLAQHPTSRVLLVARSAAGVEPTALTAAFQRAVHDADPDFTAASLMTGEDLRHRGTDDIIVPSVMVGSGGGAVLLLAALGVYGIIGFMVATRSRELAVRIALGASRRRILGTIQSDIVKLVIPGVIGGLLLGIALTRMVVPWRGLSGAAMEPVVYGVATGVAVSVALLAGLFPARRAASIEPMVAMRAE